MNTYQKFEDFIEYYQNWFKTIEEFVLSKEAEKNQIVISHDTTPMGKWFYTEGKKEFGSLEQVIFVESKFIRLHNLVGYLYEAIIAKDQSLVELYYEDYLVLSRKMIPNLELSRDYIINVRNNTPVINLK